MQLGMPKYIGNDLFNQCQVRFRSFVVPRLQAGSLIPRNEIMYRPQKCSSGDGFALLCASGMAFIDPALVQLECRIHPSSTVALHASPVEGTQASVAALALKLLFHEAVFHCLHPLHGLYEYG